MDSLPYEIDDDTPVQFWSGMHGAGALSTLDTHQNSFDGMNHTHRYIQLIEELPHPR